MSLPIIDDESSPSDSVDGLETPPIELDAVSGESIRRPSEASSDAAPHDVVIAEQGMKLSPRAYQTEMLEESLKQNIIVAVCYTCHHEASDFVC
jgi:hypothetical protein